MTAFTTRGHIAVAGDQSDGFCSVQRISRSSSAKIVAAWATDQKSGVESEA